jgi:hypothetical protein
MSDEQKTRNQKLEIKGQPSASFLLLAESRVAQLLLFLETLPLRAVGPRKFMKNIRCNGRLTPSINPFVFSNALFAEQCFSSLPFRALGLRKRMKTPYELR